MGIKGAQPPNAPQGNKGFLNVLNWLTIIWLVVEPTHLKNISQNGNLPQGSGWKEQIFETTTQIILNNPQIYFEEVSAV